MNTYREIGVAGCCGAVAGTAVAIVCDWSIVMLFPAALIGALTALVCFRPVEVAGIIKVLGREIGKSVRRGMERMRQREGISVEACMKKIAHAAFVVACTIAVLGSALLLSSIAAMWNVLLPFTDVSGRAVPVWSVVLTEVIIVSLAGLVAFLTMIFTYAARVDGGLRWMMPLTRVCTGIFQRIDDFAQVPQQLSRTKIFVMCLVTPLLLQIVGPPLLLAQCVDIVCTIILACASSKRIAAILGAMLGLCVATILHVCGVPSSLAGSLTILVASGTVGWFAGPLLYRLRAHLARKAATEAVRSS